MSTLGIDIGGSSVKGVLRASDRCVESQSARYADPDREQLIDAVRTVIDQLSGNGRQRAGVCLPGRVASDNTRIELSINMSALEDWAFDDMFGAFGLAADSLVCSDSVAAGTEIVRTNELVGRAACVSIGTGVGLAVFDDGDSVGIGSRGIGHLGMVERVHGQTIESVIGASRLRARFGDAVDQGISTMEDDDPFIEAIVSMIRLIHAIYVPRHIVLLGGVGLALRRHAERMHRLSSEMLCPVADPDWELRFGTSMFHAAMGAARLAHED